MLADLASRDEMGQARCEKFRDGLGGDLQIVGGGELVQVSEREAAPGSAENSEPGGSVYGVEQGAGERQGVEDFGALAKGNEVYGAKG